MAETEVTYHDDTPAINVKDRHSGMDFVAAVERLIGGPADGLLGESVNCQYPSDLRDIAYERIASDFWQAVEEMADKRGIGPIEQDGRSGGWLTFPKAPDLRTLAEEAEYISDEPYNDAARELTEWLAAYRAIREWSETWIADGPRKVATLVQQMAMDKAGEDAARRMFGTYPFGPFAAQKGAAA